MKVTLLAFAIMACIVAHEAFNLPRGSCGRWVKVGFDVCVDVNKKTFGAFSNSCPSSANKFIIAMKLVHKSGNVTCGGNQKDRYSYWGCYLEEDISIFVTDKYNQTIYPSPTLIQPSKRGWYQLPGYNRNSPELVFQEVGFRYVYEDQKFRIWYGEDLTKDTDNDDEGKIYMDVYFYVVDV